jgi:hypothetical protein
VDECKAVSPWCEMGSTTPWLTAEFQDAVYTITDRVVNGVGR